MKKILIIENDTDTLDVLGIILEDRGYVVALSEIKPSIKQILAISPQLIVIDYLLGDGYGNELCSDIKSNPLTNKIPVVLFSASLGIEKLANDCHADAFIAKPFDLDFFEKTLNDLVV